MATLLCWNCGSSLEEIPLPISRHANCQKCFEMLHCCRLCRFYAPGQASDCDHDRSDPPLIKEGANFCDYFKPGYRAFIAQDKPQQKAAQSEFSALFDGQDTDESAAEAKGPDGDEGAAKGAAQADAFADKSTSPQQRNPLDDLFDN